MKRVAYYGTLGGGMAGHYFKAIAGKFSREEQYEIEQLDSERIFKIFEGKKQFVFFRHGKYLCLAFPASPDDERGGSITIALVVDAKYRDDVMKAIEDSEFMKSQFKRLVKITGVQMPEQS